MGEVIIAVGATACLVAVSVFALRVLVYPDSLKGRITPEPGPVGMVMAGLVSIGWVTCAFFAVRGMLSWMPDSWGSYNKDGHFTPLHIGLAGFAAFVSVPFLFAAIKTASEQVEFKRQRVLVEGLLSLVASPASAARLAHTFDSRSDAARTPLERGAYAQLVLLAEELEASVQDIEKRTLVVGQSRIRAEKLAMFTSRVAEVTRKSSLKIETDMRAPTGETPLLVRGDAFVQQWRSTLERALEHLSLHKRDVAIGEAERGSVLPFFDSLPGGHVGKNVSITATYTLDHGGGHTDLLVKNGDVEAGIREVLRFDETIEGAVSAFFVQFEVPRVVWHGRYGRDYRFAFHEQSFVNMFVDLTGEVRRKTVDLERFDLSRPPGIRIERDGETLVVSCLGVFPTGNVSDFVLRLEGGQIVSSTQERVFSSST